ncbi:MAG: ribonuclease E/G [Rhodospirillaceae bacterium]
MSGAETELLIDRRGGLLRAAVVAGGRLTDLHIDRDDRVLPEAGSVWLGRVERIAAGLNAAFIDLGTGKAGLLGLADVRLGNRNRPEPGTAIGTVLHGGQALLVQVKAEATGAKGPTLAMDISLPGRFLVHVPFRRGVTVSKRLGDGAMRAAQVLRLQALTVGDGWIARSGCETLADDGLIVAESESLALAWGDLVRRLGQGGAPGCLCRGPDAARRAVIGHGARPLARLAVEAPVPWRSAFADWCAGAAPDLVPRLETVSGRLFERHDLEGQIAALMRPEVTLAGGAGLVIERTEALVAIDVNGGERGNPLAVNLEAAAEIARQLRLRNLGGIVVVDFLSMPKRADGERLLAALAVAVRGDPVQTEVYGLSRLGLVELTRARRGPALQELLS